MANQRGGIGISPGLQAHHDQEPTGRGLTGGMRLCLWSTHPALPTHPPIPLTPQKAKREKKERQKGSAVGRAGRGRGAKECNLAIVIFGVVTSRTSTPALQHQQPAVMKKCEHPGLRRYRITRPRVANRGLKPHWQGLHVASVGTVHRRAVRRLRSRCARSPPPCVEHSAGSVKTSLTPRHPSKKIEFLTEVLLEHYARKAPAFLHPPPRWG